MTALNIDAALAAANPLTAAQAAALPLRDAEVELVERIVAVPVRPRSGRRPRRRLVRSIGAVLVATAAVAAILTLLPSSNSDGGPAPAFAAALVRFANASPRVLLNGPGWHVVYADEEPGGYGEMHFVRGPADADGNPNETVFLGHLSVAGRTAWLTWVPGRGGLTRGRQNAATGLGVIAHKFLYEPGSHGAFGISALFMYRGRELTFGATVTNMAMFREDLRALTGVSTPTWLRALPQSVVTSADSAGAVRLMLKGVPLPPGFDAARIRGVRLVHDRYQLGAAVTGTVACMWIADWNRARTDGNTAMARRSIAAMATAPRWPILHQMAREGAWPQVLIGYARAMRRGTVVEGRLLPLAVAADSGLGCSTEWGVSLR